MCCEGSPGRSIATRAALSMSSIALASLRVGWGTHTRFWVSSSIVGGGDDEVEAEEDDDEEDDDDELRAAVVFVVAVL